MADKKRKSNRRSATTIIPPKKKNEKVLSKDEIRYLKKKKVKRKRRLKKILFGSIVCVVAVAASLLFVLTMFFKIEKIEIKGAKLYDNKVIESTGGAQIGESIFSVNEKELNEILPEKLPLIKSVKLQRKLPGTVIIEVYATREVAAFQSAAGYILIDDDGKVIDTKAQMLRDNVAVVTGAKLGEISLGKTVKFENEENTESFLNLLQSITDCEIKDITEITVNKKGEFSLFYQDRIKIKLGKTENITQKLERGKLAIDKENEFNPYSKGVLDLSVEPEAIFSAGEEQDVTVAPGYILDEKNNFVTDEYGDIVTTTNPVPVSENDETEKPE